MSKNREERSNYYLYIDGQAVPVSEQVYRVYQHYERKEEYFSYDLKTEKFQKETASFLPSREDSYERLLEKDRQFAASGQSVEEQAVASVWLEELLQSLSADETIILRKLYFEDKSERIVSMELGISKTALHQRKVKLLQKLKKLLENMFERLEEKDPEHFAVRQYKKFLLSAGKTRSSILISCGARLAPFDIRELRELMETDEMELDTLGDRKTALFVIISDTDDTFNFVVSILYTQLFNLLCDKADDVYGGRLPVHVRCLLDEFANIGLIPKFEKLIATIRSREISASIILQSQSQLKAIYKDNADTIVGNCDTTLFLGGKEKTTLKEMSEILGKETIDSFNTSETRGRELSHGLNYQKLGKQLMSEDEIAVMDGGKCILQLRGVRPFFSEKYDITKHPKYKYLSDFDKKNAFDMEKHLRRRPAIVKPDEVFDYYEVDEADLQEDAE